MKVAVQAGHLEVDKRHVRRVIRAAGAEVKAVARKLVSQQGSGRLYRGPGGSAAKYRGGYKKGSYRASAPGQPPARVTGTLARDFVVRVFRSGEGVAIRDTAFYALFLEAGAQGGGRHFRSGNGKRHYRRGGSGIGKMRVLAPRPFLTRALEQRGPTIGPRIQQALAEGVKFVRVKA